jgi:nucleoid DNA-binding protein
MTKQQFIEQVANTSGHTKAEVESIYEAIIETLSGVLAAGVKVDMRGLGVFEAKDMKARTGRNPATGESIEIPASRKVTFRAGKELKARLTGTRREP